jgi:hypothetical protein
MINLYHGYNSTQEFWESECHEFLVLRVIGESHWQAYRNQVWLDGNHNGNAADAVKQMCDMYGFPIHFQLTRKWALLGSQWALVWCVKS